ncbi:MAG: septum site-determining protein MinC [Deltaproteobacteria bacterium]
MVTIKGVNDSLVFFFGEGSLAEHMAFLEKKFTGSAQLFAGSRVVFQGKGLADLSHDDIAVLQKLCLDHGMILNNTVNHPVITQPDTSDIPAPAPEAAPVRSSRFAAPPPPRDVFIRRNLRSGQKLHAEGSVVIWGDVHESAEIVAGGDIIVMGKLGGIAHAGCYGDESSVVFAINLIPGQIRIGSKVSRAARGETKRPYPEIAYLEDGSICVREYNSQDKLPG